MRFMLYTKFVYCIQKSETVLEIKILLVKNIFLNLGILAHKDRLEHDSNSPMKARQLQQQPVPQNTVTKAETNPTQLQTLPMTW